MKALNETRAQQAVVSNPNGLLDTLLAYRRNWYWFALCGLLGLAGAYLKLRYTTPVYKISAKVLVTESSSGGSGGSGAFGDFNALLGGPSSVDNEAEIIKTRFLMEQVVQALNDQVIVFQPGTVRDVEIHPKPIDFILEAPVDSIGDAEFLVEITDGWRGQISSGEAFVADFRFGEPIHLPDVGPVRIVHADTANVKAGTYKVRVVPFDSRVSNFMGRLGVSIESNLVSVIDLSFDYPLRKKGETILNKLVEVYMENNLLNKNTIADSTIAFIDNRLAIVGRELYGIEQDIQHFRQSENLANMSSQAQILLESSRDYVNQLAEIQTQLSILEDVESYLVDERNRRVLPNAVVTNDVVFNDLIERYNALLLERGRRLLSATPDNPTVLNIDEQLNELRNDMLANLRSTRSRLNITKENLQRKTEELEREVKNVPATERVFLDLSRQQQIKHELYVYLLQKREETAISKTATVSNSRLIDPPKAAGTPFSPKRPATLLAGLLIGLIVPAAFIYFRDLLNTRVRSREDVKRMTTAPIIAEILRSRHKETLVVNKYSRSAIAEQFRTLRTNLAFYLTDPNQKTILLTSSMSGEGKSFIAINLATVLAVTGKRVVVMEMDLRKPNISVKLNNPGNAGFTNYIVCPELAPMDIVLPSGINDNLFFISSGPIPPNPAETIIHHRVMELMQTLRKQFDYVVIDAPPIGLVTDAQLLSKHADLTLYVVRIDYTYKTQLQLVDDLFSSNKMGQLAVLLNDLNPKVQQGYGYGYGGGYYDDQHDGETVGWKFWKR